ncbi:MAG: hypothetical protein KAI51_00050 [Candidatus Aenigmarchaeota archaeon]|nr:hypothetical protein [Candidatus Aenigmarchaeota archaeon]MCK5451808.1 hypothetical protein [Candidatus Aenigmarchaeota archaeon]
MTTIGEIYSLILDTFVEGIPNLTLAIIALVVGYAIGVAAYVIVRKIMVRAGVDTKLKSKQLDVKISDITAITVKWIIYLVALSQAADFLQVQIIISIINGVIAFIPGVVSAAVLLIAAYILGYFIKSAVIGEKDVYTKLIGDIVFFLVIYVGIATALPALGIDTTLINTILILIIGSICLGIAIALGLGLKDTVADMSKDFAHKYKKKKR